MFGQRSYEHTRTIGWIEVMILGIQWSNLFMEIYTNLNTLLNDQNAFMLNWKLYCHYSKMEIFLYWIKVWSIVHMLSSWWYKPKQEERPNYKCNEVEQNVFGNLLSKCAWENIVVYCWYDRRSPEWYFLEMENFLPCYYWNHKKVPSSMIGKV